MWFARLPLHSGRDERDELLKQPLQLVELESSLEYSPTARLGAEHGHRGVALSQRLPLGLGLGLAGALGLGLALPDGGLGRGGGCLLCELGGNIYI
jgi:hypothetical protein